MKEFIEVDTVNGGAATIAVSSVAAVEKHYTGSRIILKEKIEGSDNNVVILSIFDPYFISGLIKKAQEQ
ncbi:hypothetical protein [Mucilaginibacter sp.]|uniref:hypothetical protein n=1 Tax=Mucilaginibacter sp. TaxID=1882438 RepID=UPI0025E71599|nr:hypothetical protein [Mucilaginibacter sp.]